MTSSTLGEAADMDCPNQKEWRAKKLKGHLQSYPLAGPGSQGQLLEEDWGAVGKQQPQFLTIEKHPHWRQRPGWWENILGMNHYKSEDFKGKKAIHFTVSSRQQKGERGRETRPWEWQCFRQVSGGFGWVLFFLTVWLSSQRGWDHWQLGSFQRVWVHEGGVLGCACALAVGCVPHRSPNWEAVSASPVIFLFRKQHMQCGWHCFLCSATALALPAGPMLAGLSSGLLEPGDVSALLQVPDALVVILLWEKAVVAVGLRGSLLFLSVQSLYCFVIWFGLLAAGPPCCCKGADAVGNFLQVFKSSIEIVTGRERPRSGSLDGGIGGLWCFKWLSWFVPWLSFFMYWWIHCRDLENKGWSE